MYHQIDSMKSELINNLRKIPTYDEDELLITELVNEIESYLCSGIANRINQTIISFDSLFHGFIAKNQSGMEVNSKFEDYNKIIIKHYVLYYKLCWEQRNEIANDIEK